MKSHINVAKFTKRIPTEQYAYEEYSLEAAIDPSESGEDILIEMRKQVSSAFAADLVESTEQPAEKPAKGKKNGKSKTRPADDEDEDGTESAEDSSGDGEGAEDDEAADDSAGDGSDDSAEGDEEDDTGDDQDEESEEEEGDDAGDDSGDEDEPKEKPSKKGKSDTKGGKKTFKKKPQVYNRSIEQHRAIFSRCLGSVKPDWKEKLKEKAKKVSETLEGKNFLDENGEVLPEFKAEVKKLLLGKPKK